MPTNGWWPFYYALEVAAVTCAVVYFTGVPPWGISILIAILAMIGRRRHNY
jgi:hypothetical protein